MRIEEATKTKAFATPQIRASINVIYTGYWLTDRYHVVLKQFDLSQAQYNVLRILRGQKGQAINLTDIQGRMLQKNSNSTRIVEKLRIKGFVNRMLCEENRRKVEISITSDGLNLLSQVDSLIVIQEKDMFKNLSDKDAEDINKILNTLRCRMTTSDDI